LPSPQAVAIGVLSIPRTIPESHGCYKKAADACACVALMLSRGLNTSEMHCYTETMPRTQCTLASCAPILRIRCRCCITRGHSTRGIVRSNATFCSQFSVRPRKSCPSGSTHIESWCASRSCIITSTPAIASRAAHRISGFYSNMTGMRSRTGRHDTYAAILVIGMHSAGRPMRICMSRAP
jgi:hypothetical protein